MTTTAELIAFPIVPATRTDIPEGSTAPGVRAHRIRNSESAAKLDQMLASTEALLFVDMGLLLDELIRIGGRDFALSATILNLNSRGFVVVGGEK